MVYNCRQVNAGSREERTREMKRNRVHHVGGVNKMLIAANVAGILEA
jgi:hypothetical protein